MDDLRPLDAVQIRQGQIARFRWQGRWHRVQRTLESWREVNRWWVDESEMMWWRVESTDHGVWEIGWQVSDGTWWLGKIWD